MIPDDKRTLAILESYFGLQSELNESLLKELETEHLAGGEWLFKQGDPGDSFYFLIWGRLQVWIGQDGDDDAGTHLLGEVAPGETVGEISLLTGEQRSAGIRAIRDSMLVRVSRSAFERLAERHPQLVMRLAGSVASVLQKRTSGGPGRSRGLSTVAVLPLDGSTGTGAFIDQLSTALGRLGKTATIAADDLARHGAPMARLEDDQQVPESLVKWLHDQECENQFLVYRCNSRSTPWSRYAVRQSDLVILVADSGGDPTPPEWEAELQSEASGSFVKRLLVLLREDSGAGIRDTASWLKARAVDYHVHARVGLAEDVERVARLVSGTGIGLVLSGGAARGFAHLGIVKALQEARIPIDWVGGTSIGAIMGAAVVAYDWDCDRAIELCREAFVKTRPFSDYTLPLMSLISGRRTDRLLDRYLDRRIEDLPTPFFCVSSKLDDGSMNVHEFGSLPHALRASASMPGIFPPAIVDQRLTIDGAVLNNMPVDIMKRRPVGRVIAVDLASRKTYEVKYPKLPSAWSVLGSRLWPFGRRHRVPSLVTTILKATEVGTLQRMRDLGDQADLLLHPPVRGFGMTDVRSFDKIVRAGYEHAKEELAGAGQALDSWQQTADG